MASVVSLPPEIVDAILDELVKLFGSAPIRHNEKLKKNLQSCLQVSRTFRFPARRLLFSYVTLTIRTKEDNSTCSRNLRQLLEGDPELAKLVQSFRLNLQCSRHPQTIQDEHLAAILGLLPNLQKFILASLNGNLNGWRGFNDQVQTALFRLHELPYLESLELSGYNLSIPIDFVARWTTLRTLIIRASPFQKHPAINTGPVPQYIRERDFPRLTSLDLLNDFSSSDILLNVGDGAIRRELTNLKVEICGSRDRAILWNVLRRNCRMVQNLAIGNLNSELMHSTPSRNGMDIPDIPNLRSLAIKEEHLQLGVNDVGQIIDLLSSHFISAPNLESVHVSLVWMLRPSYSVFPSSASSAAVVGKADTWKKLDEKLAGASYFKRLDINMHCIYAQLPDVIRGQFAKACEWWTPENAFPILSSKCDTIVHLSFFDEVV